MEKMRKGAPVVLRIGLSLVLLWFEIIFGTLLLLGIFSRITALLLALHMLHITFTVGYNGIGVRDFGLAMGMIAVFLQGPDVWSLDKFFYKNKYAYA